MVICAKANLVPLAPLSIDDTKLLANASRHSAMSCARMAQEEKKLLSEIKDKPPITPNTARVPKSPN